MKMQKTPTSSTPVDEKEFFITILGTLAAIDGIKPEEIEFIKTLAVKFDLPLEERFFTYSPQECIANASRITNRALALELIKDMFILAYTDETFSDLEGEFICTIARALNIEAYKIKEISNWIIDRIIWLEQGNLIFEKKRL